MISLHHPDWIMWNDGVLLAPVEILRHQVNYFLVWTLVKLALVRFGSHTKLLQTIFFNFINWNFLSGQSLLPKDISGPISNANYMENAPKAVTFFCLLGAFFRKTYWNIVGAQNQNRMLRTCPEIDIVEFLQKLLNDSTSSREYEETWYLIVTCLKWQQTFLNTWEINPVIKKYTWLRLFLFTQWSWANPAKSQCKRFHSIYFPK